MLRHTPFLKAVLYYTLTAFGGPQGHIGMMIKTFVHKRHDITEEELIEYNAFCQILPGPSSTQTIMLIGWKRGGIPLALLTLLIWMLPAMLIMTVFSFLIYYLSVATLPEHLFRFIHPMAVGFASYAAFKMMRKSVNNPMTYGIMLFAIVATLIIRTAWLFPLMLVLGGIMTNFSKKRIAPSREMPKPIRWINLWLFALVFIIIGIVSEVARIYDWEYRRLAHIAENFYRFGSIVFGGSQALLPMMLIQFVALPERRGILAPVSAADIMTGYGLVQAVPGPVFSVSAFVGGMMMSAYGPFWQIAGSIVATLCIFFPSTLLLLFFFPVYQNLKKHVIIYRALEGIYAVIVGIIWASAVILFMEINKTSFDWLSIVWTVVSFCVLQFTRLPAPILVVVSLVLGWLF